MGELDGQIAVIAGTPARLIDMISREIGPKKDADISAIALCVGRLVVARAVDHPAIQKKFIVCSAVVVQQSASVA